jgi:hypothetical protein
MPIDMKAFVQNRAAFPPEELARYAGQWVAWSPDGSRIVASSAESEDAVWDQVQTLGYELADCCLSYVPAPDDVLVGPVIWNRLTAEQRERFDSPR